MNGEMFSIIKILFFTASAFILAILLTPILTHFLYKYRLGKKIRAEGKTPIFTSQSKVLISKTPEHTAPVSRQKMPHTSKFKIAKLTAGQVEQGLPTLIS